MGSVLDPLAGSQLEYLDKLGLNIVKLIEECIRLIVISAEPFPESFLDMYISRGLFESHWQTNQAHTHPRLMFEEGSNIYIRVVTALYYHLHQFIEQMIRENWSDIFPPRANDLTPAVKLTEYRYFDDSCYMEVQIDWLPF